jgi:hypothetical protein
VVEAQRARAPWCERAGPSWPRSEVAPGQNVGAAVVALKVLASERAYVSSCCMGCGATRKLKTCAKCRVARFCGAECVRSAWPAHKPHCKRWEAEGAAAAE